MILRHLEKEQYLKEHYDIERNEELKDGYNCHSCGKHFSKKIYLWRHICSMHGVITQKEIDQTAMGKSFEALKKFKSNKPRPVRAAASEVIIGLQRHLGLFF